MKDSKLQISSLFLQKKLFNYGKKFPKLHRKITLFKEKIVLKLWSCNNLMMKLLKMLNNKIYFNKESNKLLYQVEGFLNYMVMILLIIQQKPQYQAVLG